MSRLREAFDAGGRAAGQRSAAPGILDDPAGQNPEQECLRAMGKWRFVRARGMVGWGVPMFLWIALSHLSEDFKSARIAHQSVFQYLLHSWLAAFLVSVLSGTVVGILAWRRLTSDVWPGKEPDPESSITRLGSLRPRD